MTLYPSGILKINGAIMATYTQPFNVDIIQPGVSNIKSIQMVNAGSGTPAPHFPRITLLNDSFIWFTQNANNRPFKSGGFGFTYPNAIELLPNFQVKITGNNLGGYSGQSWEWNWGSPLTLNISEFVTAAQYLEITREYEVLEWR